MDFPIKAWDLPPGFLPVSSGLYNINHHRLYMARSISPTLTSSVSLETLLNKQLLDLSRRLEIGMILVEAMPRLLYLWPTEWGTRDISFLSTSDLEQGLIELALCRLCLGTPLIRPVFNFNSSESSNTVPVRSKTRSGNSPSKYLKSLGLVLAELVLGEHIYEDDLSDSSTRETILERISDQVGPSYEKSIDLCISDYGCTNESDTDEYFKTIIQNCLEAIEACPRFSNRLDRYQSVPILITRDWKRFIPSYIDISDDERHTDDIITDINRKMAWSHSEDPPLSLRDLLYGRLCARLQLRRHRLLIGISLASSLTTLYEINGCDDDFTWGSVEIYFHQHRYGTTILMHNRPVWARRRRHQHRYGYEGFGSFKGEIKKNNRILILLRCRFS
jgi:hypothetical protein